MKIVAFFIRHFTERGTEVSTYDYAHYNEQILGNKSLIVCHSKARHLALGWNIYDEGQPSRSKFEKRFRVIEIDDISEMKIVIKHFGITHFYTQSSGFQEDIYQFQDHHIWDKCTTIYHTVFGVCSQNSTILCTIGNHINNKFSTNLPVIPYIVEQHKKCGDLRSMLGIPSDGLVFGRHGGYNTFNIAFVKNEIEYCLAQNNNIYFVFMNTAPFFSHPRIFYLHKLISKEDKNRFIDTCDLMIHARAEGETFGLAVAEFSAANKPVVTYSGGDIEHLRILGDKCMIYKNSSELREIFSRVKEFSKPGNQWNAYSSYEPFNVIRIFHDIAL